MIEYKLSLASSGAVKAPGYEDMLRFGYNKNCGVYRLRVTAADEWKGMKLRCSGIRRRATRLHHW